jgi:hypothetical protein
MATLRRRSGRPATRITGSCAGALLSLSLLASGSMAADKCSGYVSNVTQTVSTREIASGHTLISFIFHSTTTSDNSPLTAAGECSGYVLTTPDGKTRASGACLRKTKAGDSFSDAWVLEPGAQRGSWKQMGGTGVFAGKSWSGWFEDIYDDGKVSLSRFGGNCN